MNLPYKQHKWWFSRRSRWLARIIYGTWMTPINMYWTINGSLQGWVFVIYWTIYILRAHIIILLATSIYQGPESTDQEAKKKCSFKKYLKFLRGSLLSIDSQENRYSPSSNLAFYHRACSEESMFHLHLGVRTEKDFRIRAKPRRENGEYTQWDFSQIHSD